MIREKDGTWHRSIQKCESARSGRAVDDTLILSSNFPDRLAWWSALGQSLVAAQWKVRRTPVGRGFCWTLCDLKHVRADILATGVRSRKSNRCCLDGASRPRFVLLWSGQDSATNSRETKEIGRREQQEEHRCSCKGSTGGFQPSRCWWSEAPHAASLSPMMAVALVERPSGRTRGRDDGCGSKETLPDRSFKAGQHKRLKR
ncbi:hypothetical protein L1887_48084 [Cichorium endivia]|nr:hypothetical protein L1887_48084 [Cichorium endivia]